MCHVGALSKALGILVWILGPESPDTRIFIPLKNVSMCVWTRHISHKYLLHFEQNYFTGVNRLTPQTELLHTSKNEVKVIVTLVA